MENTIKFDFLLMASNFAHFIGPHIFYVVFCRIESTSISGAIKRKKIGFRQAVYIWLEPIFLFPNTTLQSYLYSNNNDAGQAKK